MKVALLGLLQSGKSTILAGLTGKAVPVAGAATIHEAIVPVPDDRFEWLEPYCKPKKTTYATIDCLDLPGFNFGDDHGRAAARRLIGQIRTVDLLVLVVRAFENPAVPPYRNAVDPARNCFWPTSSLSPLGSISSKSRSTNPPKPRHRTRPSWRSRRNCRRRSNRRSP